MNTDKLELERYLSRGELMTMLGISRGTVYRLMAKGMPNIMLGSVHRFPKDEVLTWLEKTEGGTLSGCESKAGW